ncbi:MAG: A/G-specific adenine glycosylase [Chloroflexota bacterium]|nr:A/G-specific adenine glycosylase [Chloroflexota bacterium]
MDDQLTDTPSLAGVRSSLLAWYAAEHRDFPWRHTADPYAVLVSEVMLQQTQASRVVERYPTFMDRFPTAAALAAASEAEVLAAWSGLGYNRRALALRRAAAAVAADGWPREVPALERLPGIGPYTARAVASLAFGEAIGVVDTNVRRWLVRRFGLSVAAGLRDLQPLADALARAGNPADAASWTHATMEFGAAVCMPRNPRCDACPIAVGCPSRGRAATVPVPRQAAFAGSDRAHRGRLLRALTETRTHAMTLAAGRRMLPEPAFERIVVGLERDGLLHRSRGRLRLGGRAEPAATIGQ